MLKCPCELINVGQTLDLCYWSHSVKLSPAVAEHCTKEIHVSLFGHIVNRISDFNLLLFKWIFYGHIQYFISKLQTTVLLLRLLVFLTYFYHVIIAQM